MVRDAASRRASPARAVDAGPPPAPRRRAARPIAAATARAAAKRRLGRRTRVVGNAHGASAGGGVDGASPEKSGRTSQAPSSELSDDAYESPMAVMRL